jgi:ribonuclease P protein component
VPNIPVGRLLLASDFEKVLARPAIKSSRHFAVHALETEPGLLQYQDRRTTGNNLSTAGAKMSPPSVDRFESAGPTHGCQGPSQWLGMVVPKRHARRAVTRTLLKRQIREGVCCHAESLPAGLLVVRLRSDFDKRVYPSATSVVLRDEVRAELEQLLGSVGIASV